MTFARTRSIHLYEYSQLLLALMLVRRSSTYQTDKGSGANKQLRAGCGKRA